MVNFFERNVLTTIWWMLQCNAIKLETIKHEASQRSSERLAKDIIWVCAFLNNEYIVSKIIIISTSEFNGFNNFCLVLFF